MDGLGGELVAILAPVFTAVALGFLWVRSGQPFDQVGIGRLIYLVATPCLIFATLTGSDLAVADFGQMAGLAALVFAGVMGVSAAAAHLAGLDRPTTISLLTFPNAGNMGLPISLFAFGEAGLGLAVSFFAVSTMLHFSAGVAIMAGRIRPRFLLRQPVILAVGAAVAVMLAGLAVPPAIANTVGLIGDMAVPLMLLSLGAALAGVRPSLLLAGGGFALARPALGVAVAGAVIALLPVGGLTAKVLLIQAAMPSAVMTYVFAQHYDRQPALVASAVFLSSLASLIYLPILLAFVL